MLISRAFFVLESGEIRALFLLYSLLFVNLLDVRALFKGIDKKYRNGYV